MGILRWDGRVGLVLAACVVFLSGCQMDLDGRSRQYAKYEKEKDEFHFFWTCTDIRASRVEIGVPKKITSEEHRQQGLDHLESMWKDRANVVMMPGPFGPIAFLRKENRMLETLNLFKREEKVEKFTTNFDLNAIRIQPGEMFLSPQGTLCYTHHCVFPGKTIDQAFQLTMVAINAEVAKTSLSKVEERKAGKQKRVAWKDLRAELWKAHQVGQRFGLAWQVLEKFSEALDDESHTRLSEQGKKQELKLRREGMKFLIEMRLTPGDAKELCSLLNDALHGELNDPKKNNPAAAAPDDRAKKLEVMALEAFRDSKATSDGDGRVTLHVEVLPILKVLEEEGGPFGLFVDKTNFEKNLGHSKADVAELEKRKIPVSRELKLEELLGKFQGMGN